MNYIEEILLENFQSHKKTVITPAGPGQLTVIVGASDSGKTALIRGLRWLAYNSPNGTDFVRVGTQQGTVSAIMAQGQKITRTRSRGGVNRYILEDLQHPAPRIFESFGTGVPLEAQQALELEPISIGEIEFTLNFSEQLDGPFLGNSTPSTARAKMLGKLSGVEEVDHAGKTLGTDLYRKRREVEGIRSQIDYLGKKIEEYGYLDELRPMVEIVSDAVDKLKIKIERKKALQELNIKLKATVQAILSELERILNLQPVDNLETAIFALAERNSRMQSLGKFASDVKIFTEGLNRSEAILEGTKAISQAETTLTRLQENHERCRQLYTLGKAMINVSRELDQVKTVLAKSDNLTEIEKKLNNAAAAKEKLVNLYSRLNELQFCQRSLVQTKQLIQKNIDTEKTAADELLAVFKEAGACPLCGSHLDYEKLKGGQIKDD